MFFALHEEENPHSENFSAKRDLFLAALRFTEGRFFRMDLRLALNRESPSMTSAMRISSRSPASETHPGQSPSSTPLNLCPCPMTWKGVPLMAPSIAACILHVSRNCALPRASAVSNGGSTSCTDSTSKPSAHESEATFLQNPTSSFSVAIILM